MRENRNFQIGNFNKAKREIEQILNNKGDSSSIEEKFHISKQIEAAENYYQKLIPQNPGETYFPVIDNENGDDRVFTLRVIKSKNEYNTEIDFYKSWEYVKNLIGGFLDRKLNSSDILSVVLDWKFEEIGIEIIKPHEKFNLEISEISGNSMQLAMGVAFFSFLLNEKIPSNYAFSGSLAENSGGLSIKEVESIERKKKIISEEKPEVTEFITFNEFDDFETLIIKIFGNAYLEKIIENLTNGIPYDVEILKTEIEKNVEIFIDSKEITKLATVYHFSHPNYPQKNLCVLNQFFDKIETLTNDNIIILDNLRPNFAPAMIVPKFRNKIAGFVAVVNSQIKIENPEYSKGAVVVYKSDGNSEIEVGDLIYF